MSPVRSANLYNDRPVLPGMNRFNEDRLAGSNQRLPLRKIQHLVQLHLVDFSPRLFTKTKTKNASDIDGIHLVITLLKEIVSKIS
mgnify:CR=1 FL=1